MADTVLRPATITRIPRPASDAAINSQEWVWTNGLLGLFTPAAAPFAQLDWPNPRGIMVAPAWFILPNRLLGLFTPSLDPFAQLDWPNPMPQRSNVSLAMIGNMLETTLAPPAAGSTAAIWLRRRRD